MALLSFLDNVSPATFALLVAPIFIFHFLYEFVIVKPEFPKNAPPRAHGHLPLLGALQFFTNRWNWGSKAIAKSSTGNYSFYFGNLPIIGLSGEASRKFFLESKELNFSAGYERLLGGGATLDKDLSNNRTGENGEATENFGGFFNRRLISLLKGPVLKKRLPLLLKDSRECLDELLAQKDYITDPFDSIYRMVFRLTMRTVACDEIADDPVRLAQCLKYFETIESSATALDVMFPWLPTYSKAKRTYAGAQLYRIFKNVIDTRKREQRRVDDAVNYMVESGDNVVDIITFVLGSLFAGQLNSGINAAYLLCGFAQEPHWYKLALEEVHKVADKYSSLPTNNTTSTGPTPTLRDRLPSIPLEAWETEFPVVDLCLKESIRINLGGSMFRQNLSGHDLKIDKEGKEVIPDGAYVHLAVRESSFNPAIFSEPGKFDPERFVRGEDKRQAYGWAGWGAGRHPCIGMRFAKLEMSMIVAFFLAYFEDLELLDAQKKPLDRVPMPNPNNHSAKKLDEKVFIRYKPTKEVSATA